MTDREHAAALARQILTESRDLGWLVPLAKEFLKLVEHGAQGSTSAPQKARP